MTKRQVIPRLRAEQDIDDAVDFYYGEGGSDLALRFVDELQSVFVQLTAHPEAGSPRYSIELEIPELPHWPMQRFPYLIFYAVTPTRWRSGACFTRSGIFQNRCRVPRLNNCALGWAQTARQVEALAKKI